MHRSRSRHPALHQVLVGILLWVFEEDSGHIIFPSLAALPFTQADKIYKGSDGVISIFSIPNV